VTVILLSCSYEGREFVRVGYYVNNEYTDEALVENPPAKPIIEKIKRNILAEKPRVTRFAIKWLVPDECYSLRYSLTDC
jgi:histone chaperone ASF1